MNKRGAFQGLNKVYKFTLYQLYKNKANLATFGIFIAVALFAIPVMSFFMGSGSTEGASFYTQVMTMDEFMGRDVVDTDSRYSIQYAYSILVMIVCIFAVTYIVRAILEEKSSKLVETLLVSIRSEDMILGKILAVITFIFSMVLSIIAAFVLSLSLIHISSDGETKTLQTKNCAMRASWPAPMNLSINLRTAMRHI